jgi:thiol:disulfide interchange protein
MFLSWFPARFRFMVLSAFALLLFSASAVAQTPAPAFDEIEKWKGSLTATTITSLQNWYSTDPPAKFIDADRKPVPGIVILVFGGNWCYDCHVLDQAFHQADVAPLLEKNFQVVHVNIGDDGKSNHGRAAQYQVPLEKGVPALAILGPDGKLLYAQKNGEWESARNLDPDDVIAFLNKWKP